MKEKYFTKQGLEKLKKELDYLKNVKQKEIAEQLHKAAGFGDFSENAAYDQAKEAKAFLVGRILELEQIISNAKIIEKKKKADKVQLGSTVLVAYNGTEEKITLVGPAEADFGAGKISNISPLGAALCGQPSGKEIAVETPEGVTKYKIIKIE